MLGAILQDAEAITRVLDFLNPEDFYRENHAQIYRACTRLFQDGEPIDNVTVTDALDKAGVLERVGGRAGLLLLQETVPTAANIEYYGRIVKERSYKRRLIHAGGTVAQLGYDPAVEAEDALSQAQAAVYNIAEDRIRQDFEKLYDLLRPAMDRIDAQMASGKGVVGIPSGFTDLDRLTSGFKPGELVILAGRPGVGKALALDTPIPTPSGWTTMGALRVGDQVFDEGGNACTVTRATDVMYGRRCFEVVFSDGEVIVADGEHLWATTDRAARKTGDRTLAVHTTDEIAETLVTPDGRANHAVPVAAPLRYPESQLPVDPYVLGAWLGDGHSASATITVADSDRAILDQIRAAGVEVTPLRRNPERTPMYRLGGGRAGAHSVKVEGKLDCAKVAAIRAAVAGGATQRSQAALYAVSTATTCLAIGGQTWSAEPVGSLQTDLRRLGVIANKHIPRAYLQAGVQQRVSLLQGLMDTDGHVTRTGHAEFCTTNPRLADGVRELATSLGIIAYRREDRARLLGVDLGPRYRIGFKTEQPVFRLPRKVARLRQVGANWPSKDRRIVDVVPSQSVPVRCIQVDSPNHLFLAGRGCIPTHNTSFALNIALQVATELKIPIAMFSLEMSKDQLVERLLCEHARIDAQRMHRGQLSDAEYDRLAQALGPLSEAPIFIDDAPTLDELTVLLKSRQIHLREKVGLILIDYLQLMHGRSRGDDSNRVQEVSAISRSLKMVARELNVAVVALSQLSRAVEQRTDKRPMLSDLRESGSIEQDSDQVIFLYRDDYYKDDVRPGIAEVILAKNRNGPTGKAELKFVKEQTRFYNLEARRPEPAQ